MHIPSPGIDLNPTSLEREASGGGTGHIKLRPDGPW